MLQLLRSYDNSVMRMLVPVLLVVAALTARASSSNLVNVSFYSEALCPDCDRFTEGEMKEAIEKVSMYV